MLGYYIMFLYFLFNPILPILYFKIYLSIYLYIYIYIINSEPFGKNKPYHTVFSVELQTPIIIPIGHEDCKVDPTT